jgi:hypothetical protein
MPGHSRPEGWRASHAYVLGIHVLDIASIKDVDGMRNSGLPELRK